MKNKTIWLHEDTYNRLSALLGRRETFDECVQRLCSVMETLKAIPDTLGPAHILTGRDLTDARAKNIADAPRDS